MLISPKADYTIEGIVKAMNAAWKTKEVRLIGPTNEPNTFLVTVRTSEAKGYNKLDIERQMQRPRWAVMCSAWADGKARVLK